MNEPVYLELLNLSNEIQTLLYTYERDYIYNQTNRNNINNTNYHNMNYVNNRHNYMYPYFYHNSNDYMYNPYSASNYYFRNQNSNQTVSSAPRRSLRNYRNELNNINSRLRNLQATLDRINNDYRNMNNLSNTSRQETDINTSETFQIPNNSTNNINTDTGENTYNEENIFTEYNPNNYQQSNLNTNTNPINTNPINSEPINTDPINTDPTNSEPINTDPINIDPINTYPINTYPINTNPINSYSNTADYLSRRTNYSNRLTTNPLYNSNLYNNSDPVSIDNNLFNSRNLENRIRNIMPELLEITVFNNNRRVMNRSFRDTNTDTLEDVPIVPSLNTIRESSEVLLYSSSNSQYTSCSICRNDFEENEIIRKLNNCNHIFHMACIDTWFETNIRCPICRNDLRENTTNQDDEENISTSTEFV